MTEQKEALRTYKCKDEELPVIAQYVASSLKRDLADFEAFSPVFSAEYVRGFEQKTDSVKAIVAPESETARLKVITARLYQALESLYGPVNRLAAYLRLAKAELAIAPADFGHRKLRQAIHTKDVEKALDSLHLISVNIQNYGEPLVAKGLTQELEAAFTDAAQAIDADNQAQYEILSERKNRVLENLGLLNDLYASVSEILSIGKALYKTVNAAKTQDYTFSKLRSMVRRYGNGKTDKKTAEPGSGE